MSSHHLNAGAAYRRHPTRTTGLSGDIVMAWRWPLAAGGSVGVGGFMLVNCLLAGAPVAASLTGAAAVGIALFLYCAALFWVLDRTGSWAE